MSAYAHKRPQTHLHRIHRPKPQPPVFLTKLIPITALEKQNVELAATIEPTENVLVKWSVNGKKVIVNCGYDKATGRCWLTLPNAHPSDSGEYSVEVVSPGGKAECSATVEVNGTRLTGVCSGPCLYLDCAMESEVKFHHMKAHLTSCRTCTGSGRRASTAQKDRAPTFCSRRI